MRLQDISGYTVGVKLPEDRIEWIASIVVVVAVIVTATIAASLFWSWIN